MANKFDFYCKEMPSLLDIVILAEDCNFDIGVSKDRSKLILQVNPFSTQPPAWWTRAIKQNKEALLQQLPISNPSKVVVVFAEAGGPYPTDDEESFDGECFWEEDDDKGIE